MSQDTIVRAIAIGAGGWLIASLIFAWGWNRFMRWQLEQDRQARLAAWRRQSKAAWSDGDDIRAMPYLVRRAE